MIFNSKQLEELENINDSTGAFEEEGDDDAGFDEVGEAAMDWRRPLVEEAAENMKRSKTRPVEQHIQYPIHSMLFDREARRFGRVQRSVPGYLKIVYLSGGDREYGNLDMVGYLRDQGAQKRVSELAEQLGVADIDVSHELERLGIVPLEELEAPAVVEEAAPAAPAAKGKKAPAPVPVAQEEEAAEDESEQEEGAETEDDTELPSLDGDGDADSARTPAKGPAHKPGKAPAQKGALGKTAAKPAVPPKAPPKLAAKAPAKVVAPSKAPAAKGAPVKAVKTGKTVNPIDDPNGYIKANYTEMSNRELARMTGLSEHTVRRKLGEWSLKRKKEA